MSSGPNPLENRKPKTGRSKPISILAVGIAAIVVVLAYRFDFLDDASIDSLLEIANVLLESESQSTGWTGDVIDGSDDESAPSADSDREHAGQGNGGTETRNLPYQIYFTDPTCPSEEERKGGVDETIALDILQASEQVDIAAFDLDSEPLVNALIELESRGLLVRVVTDEDYGELPSIRRLRRHGISVIEDKRSGLMHNKFIVIDQKTLWVGSMNFTSNGVYCNDNNVVRIESSELAANYVVEMNEMYDERSFGPKSPANTPNEKLTIAGIQVENYFSPEKEMELVNVIARTVVRAQEEILFMAFSFTNEEIGEAMLGRADAGVQIRGLFESAGSSTESSYYPIMSAAGLDNVQVYQDANPYIMHHKVIIVDRETVVFGSFNFSANANRKNDENIIIIHHEAFAQEFVDEFERLWDAAVVHRGE
ncbi:hypothetical protein KFU94_69510 [Chloroflexi bacterium TSY]|nr:hypothetical protein [Chloroflexi bacterium TSY]